MVIAPSTGRAPWRRICAPASEASRCGVQITPLVISELSRGDELDRPGLDLEQSRQEARIFAGEVDAHFLWRSHGDAFAVHELHLRVGLVHVRSGADGAN